MIPQRQAHLPDGFRGEPEGSQPSYLRKDLGISFQDDLHFAKHLADKVKKANSMLCLIHRSVQYIDNEMLVHLYKALARPHVEYVLSVWSLFKLHDIKLVEEVQRKATRMSRDFRNEPCNIRFTTLGLSTLQFRRDRADMLHIFKTLNGYEDIDSSAPKDTAYTRCRCHSGIANPVQIVSTPPTSSNGGPNTIFWGKLSMRTRWMTCNAPHKSWQCRD